MGPSYCYTFATSFVRAHFFTFLLFSARLLRLSAIVLNDIHSLCSLLHYILSLLLGGNMLEVCSLAIQFFYMNDKFFCSYAAT